ncbi:cobyrinic acid a,c-diamide synthase [Haloarchaeobius sp. FL176]|uniref:cobyrinic acid a,c-diamide synthase n=1 Tax=Haloarchaeobius sp. FL176 TaxID=2967129 RepID=UPI002148DB9D
MRGLVVAGTSSGVGKTVATLATIRALQRAGHDVQPAKAGADFIDPSHHAQVAGKPSRTLDTWLEGQDGCRRNYYRGEGDICVVEGVMGMYDGDVSSTAAVAAALDLPVVLVVDASAGMESVAATALGFRTYADELSIDVDVVGVLAQRAHGGRHERGIRDALPDDLTYLGRVPPREGLEIPDRHLGLHMGDEAPVDDDALDEAADHVRTDRLLDLARDARRPAATADGEQSRAGSDRRPTVAIARDAAFRFVYPATMEHLRTLADVTTFAPVAGDDLPDCDAVYLPGGYPERHAAALSDAPALGTLAERAADGIPVLGECGGLMALARSLTTVDGDRYRMADVLPAAVRLHERYQALDHVELRATTDGPTAAANARLRGHEFHYSSATPDSDARFAFELVRGEGITDGKDGLTEYRTVGTYCHCHGASGAFDRLVEAAAGDR